MQPWAEALSQREWGGGSGRATRLPCLGTDEEDSEIQGRGSDAFKIPCCVLGNGILSSLSLSGDLELGHNLTVSSPVLELHTLCFVKLILSPTPSYLVIIAVVVLETLVGAGFNHFSSVLDLFSI